MTALSQAEPLDNLLRFEDHDLVQQFGHLLNQSKVFTAQAQIPASKMQRYVKMLDQHTNAINKINKVLDMKATTKEQRREEVLLKLIKENYKSKTVR